MGMGEKGVGIGFTFSVCVCVCLCVLTSYQQLSSYGDGLRFSFIQKTGEARD